MNHIVVLWTPRTIIYSSSDHFRRELLVLVVGEHLIWMPYEDQAIQKLSSGYIFRKIGSKKTEQCAQMQTDHVFC